MCKYMCIVGKDAGTVVKNLFSFRTKFGHDEPPWVCIHHHHTRTETEPWQYILKIMLVAQICTKNIFAHCKSTVCMFSTIQRSFTGKASNQNDSSNTFSYTLCQTKPNCIDLWDLNVVGLLVLVTLHTVSPCVLLCLVHTFPTGSHVNKRINSIAIYCLSLRFFCK